MNAMKKRIQETLRQIEREENVRVFYACESGSRAWGFPSADSDFDVRFLYVHPPSWYLSIDEGRDVIERPIDDALDVSGWDARKALKLLRKSNPPLLEWLASPIIYHQDAEATARLRQLVPLCYGPTPAFHHYLHMATGNYRDYLRGETVLAKKYFYVLRPTLAMLWIEQNRGVVPMEFDILVQTLLEDEAVKSAVETLLERKKRGKETDREAPIAPIQNFLEAQLERLAHAAPSVVRGADATPQLNEFFRWLVAR